MNRMVQVNHGEPELFCLSWEDGVQRQTLLGVVLPPPSERQTLLFSATLTQSLVKLQQAAMEDAHVFQVGGGLCVWKGGG